MTTHSQRHTRGAAGLATQGGRFAAALARSGWALTMAWSCTTTVLAQPHAGAGRLRPLTLLGISAGTDRTTLRGVIDGLGGRLSCRRSTVDVRLSECTGSIAVEAEAGRATLDVTASLVRDSLAVLLVHGMFDEATVRRWRDTLAREYGDVPPHRRGEQTTWEWVRQGRMLRLSTRMEGSRRAASASLVHGPLLDSLGNPPGGG